MLQLDETLFVEHKSDIGDGSAYGLVSTVASFVNTLGGWLLLGVTKGAPTNTQSAWADPDQAPTLVDAVRDRLRDQIDPLPAFEAKVLSHADGPVGVVRVYESSDTPHVAIQSGAIFVREVAGVANAAAPSRPVLVLARAGSVRIGQLRYAAELDDDQAARLVRFAANAYARSAGVAAWDRSST